MDNHFMLTYIPYFKPENINELIQRLSNNLQEYEKLNIEFKDEYVPARIVYECMVSFTSLTTPKNIKDDLQFFIELLNTHYFEEISNTFDDDEVAKVWNKVMEVLSASEKIERMMKKTQDDIKKLDIKSPELHEKIHGENKSEKQIPEA